MSASDALELAELSVTNEPYMPSYESEGWSYINDFNNNNYQTQVQFSTKDVIQRKIVWRDAYVAMPLNVQAGNGVLGTPYSPAIPASARNPAVARNPNGLNNETKLALKNSVLNLVYGLIL